MKKTLLILAIIFSGVLLRAQSDDATLEETTDWMTSKVMSHYDTYLKKWFQVSLQWNQDKKKMQYSFWQTQQIGDKPSSKTFIEFDPKQIDPNSIYSEDVKLINGESYSKIHFSCNDGSGCIRMYVENYDAAGAVTSTNELVNWKGYDIPLYPETVQGNENLPQRFMKAFKHLIVLCGGKKEKF